MIANIDAPWHCKCMTDEIKITIESNVGIIRLNRPRAINALTPDMILLIRDTLRAWDIDHDIRLVIFEGEGEKGFCAGGDVRWTRDKVLSGAHGEAFEFFALEYEMNHLISTFSKPIVALTHGVVMGGGIGIAGHAKYRIATQGARFAMPEGAIGFYCDVGVRSLLAGVERQRALMFMMHGGLVGIADALALNLSDCMIGGDDILQVRTDLIALGDMFGDCNNLNSAIQDLMKSISHDPGQPEFCLLADAQKEIFAGTDCVAIIERIESRANGNSDFSQVAQTIMGRCPTSHYVHVACLDAARKDPEIGAVLEADLRLAHHLVVRNDFIEGVRAVLVDKDNTPIWNPSLVSKVDEMAINTALA